MPWVYILKSTSDKYYIGSTSNLTARLRHHHGGHTPSSKRLGTLRREVFTQEYPTLEEARSVERKLKELKRKDYIEKIIRDGYIKIRP